MGFWGEIVVRHEVTETALVMGSPLRATGNADWRWTAPPGPAEIADRWARGDYIALPPAGSKLKAE